MRAAKIPRLVRIKRGMDAAIDHHGAAFPRSPADCHAAQCVAGVNPDPDNIAGVNRVEVHLFQRFIGDDGVAARGRRGRSKYIKPSRSDHANSKRSVAGVYQMNAHR